MEPLAEVEAAFAELAAADEVGTLAALATPMARRLSGATGCRLYLADHLTGPRRLASSDPAHLPRATWTRARQHRFELRGSRGPAAGLLRVYWAPDSTPAPSGLLALRLLVRHLAAQFDRLYSRERDLAALHAVGSGAFGSGGLNGALTEMGRRIMRACGAECGGILLWDQDLDRLVVEVCVERDQGEPAPGQPACGRCTLCWPSGDGLVTAALTERRTVVVGDVRAMRTRTRTDIQSVIAAPMLLDGRPVGVISLGHSRPRAFTGAHARMLSSIAGDAAWAVRSYQNRVAAEELALTSERTRIAQEIHDGVAQDLALLAMRAGTVPRDGSEAAAAVADIRQQLLRDIEELRRAVYALRPIDLEKMGLEAALRKLVAEFGEHQRLRTDLRIGTLLRDLDPRREAVVFRTVQEGLANAAKHGQAGRVTVRLSSPDPDVLEVEVADDGVGFAPGGVAQPSARGGLGLMQTRERLAALGGSLEIHTRPGAGTRLLARLPTR